MCDKILEVKNIRKSFGKVEVLKNNCMSAERGKLIHNVRIIDAVTFKIGVADGVDDIFLAGKIDICQVVTLLISLALDEEIERIEREGRGLTTRVVIAEASVESGCQVNRSAIVGKTGRYGMESLRNVGLNSRYVKIGYLHRLAALINTGCVQTSVSRSISVILVAILSIYIYDKAVYKRISHAIVIYDFREVMSHSLALFYSGDAVNSTVWVVGSGIC